MEYAEFKSTLSKMIRVYDKKEKALTKLHDDMRRVKDEVERLEVQFIIETKLLSEWEWEYNSSSSEHITFTCKRYRWHELEEFAFGEGWSHWSVSLSPDDLVHLRKDDSDYSIIIKNIDPNYVRKWIATLGIDIDIKAIKDDVVNIRHELAHLEKLISV